MHQKVQVSEGIILRSKDAPPSLPRDNKPDARKKWEHVVKLTSAILTVATLMLALSAGTALAANLAGTERNDALLGRGGDDVVFGRGGSDVVRGGAGRDAVYGDAGRDVLLGGPGDDHLYADDGRRDVVRCGPGRDTVFADRYDRVFPGCEVDGRALLKGGVLATFEASGERFQVWVTNPRAMWDLLRLRRGESTASIPNGRILRGPGQAGHNAPYSWHLDPEDLEMADFTVEVCDARPTYVEENVDEFVDNVGRYCPWNAELVDLNNYTGGEIKPPPPPVVLPDER